MLYRFVRTCGWAVSLGLRWGQNIIIMIKQKIFDSDYNEFLLSSRNDATRPRQVEHQGTLRLVVRQRYR